MLLATSVTTGNPAPPAPPPPPMAVGNGAGEAKVGVDVAEPTKVRRAGLMDRPRLEEDEEGKGEAAVKDTESVKRIVLTANSSRVASGPAEGGSESPATNEAKEEAVGPKLRFGGISVPVPPSTQGAVWGDECISGVPVMLWWVRSLSGAATEGWCVEAEAARCCWWGCGGMVGGADAGASGDDAEQEEDRSKFFFGEEVDTDSRDAAEAFALPREDAESSSSGSNFFSSPSSCSSSSFCESLLSCSASCLSSSGTATMLPILERVGKESSAPGPGPVLDWRCRRSLKGST